MEYNKSEGNSEEVLLNMEKAQVKDTMLLAELMSKAKVATEFIKNSQKISEKNIWMIEVEYYWNNCNSYFDADSQGFGYPTCPYCGSDNVSDF